MFRPLAAFASSSVHQFTHSRADYITHGGQVIKSRWGDELTAEKMKECIWFRPEVVAQIEFLEWTAGNRLRHSKFVGLREDKDPEVWSRNRSETPESGTENNGTNKTTAKSIT